MENRPAFFNNPKWKREVVDGFLTKDISKRIAVMWGVSAILRDGASIVHDWAERNNVALPMSGQVIIRTDLHPSLGDEVPHYLVDFAKEGKPYAVLLSAHLYPDENHTWKTRIRCFPAKEKLDEVNEKARSEKKRRLNEEVEEAKKQKKEKPNPKTADELYDDFMASIEPELDNLEPAPEPKK